MKDKNNPNRENDKSYLHDVNVNLQRDTMMSNSGAGETSIKLKNKNKNHESINSDSDGEGVGDSMYEKYTKERNKVLGEGISQICKSEFK